MDQDGTFVQPTHTQQRNVGCSIFRVTLQDSVLHKAADWTLSVAIPVHMHITTNALVTDYVPTKYRGKSAAK